jgi:acyl dehydratase
MTAPLAEAAATVTAAQKQASAGSTVGVSDWITVDQQRIDGFADITEDHQFLHVDVEAARRGPFGGTIAHGFLSLSLFSRMAETGLPPIEGCSAVLNYGFDRVRFLAPVAAGSRVRARFILVKATPRAAGQVLFQYQVDVEIEGGERPALMADWLVLALFDSKENAG